MFSGIVISTTIVPDINPTPPFEFPSDGLHVKIINFTEAMAKKSSNSSISYFGNNEKNTTVESTNQFREDIVRQLNGNVLTSPSLPINVIAKISGNYAENYIENKFYSNHVEENWSTIITLSVIFVMAFIVLGCSALCMKKVLK